jgi:hypothetical protein
MLPTELDYLVRQEQRQDLLRALEKERLLRSITRQRGNGPDLYRHSLAWLGEQLVKWGATLQRYASASASKERALRLP